MQISRLSDLRPRTVWDIVDDAFDLYRENFALFAGISAVLIVPFQVLQIFWSSLWFRSLLGASSPDPSQAFGSLFAFFGGMMLILPLNLVVSAWQSGAVAIAVQDRLSGRASSAASAYRRLFQNAMPLLGASLLVGLLALGISLITCGIGVLIVSVYYAFIGQAVALENRGAAAAGRRSRDMVAGYGGKVFGLIMLLGLVTATLTLGITAIMELVTEMVPFFKTGDLATQQMRELVLSQVAQALGVILLAPLGPIAITLQYYDLRVRREGLDIEAQATQMGVPLAPDAFGGIPNPRPHNATGSVAAAPPR